MILFDIFNGILQEIQILFLRLLIKKNKKLKVVTLSMTFSLLNSFLIRDSIF